MSLRHRLEKACSRHVHSSSNMGSESPAMVVVSYSDASRSNINILKARTMHSVCVNGQASRKDIDFPACHLPIRLAILEYLINDTSWRPT